MSPWFAGKTLQASTLQVSNPDVKLSARDSQMLDFVDELKQHLIVARTFKRNNVEIAGELVRHFDHCLCNRQDGRIGGRFLMW
jgi:hypothetical protein